MKLQKWMLEGLRSMSSQGCLSTHPSLGQLPRRFFQNDAVPLTGRVDDVAQTPEKKEGNLSQVTQDLREVDYDPSKKNYVAITGILRGPVESRSFSSGNTKSILKVGVGNQWIDVVVWGNLAQAAANTVTEGQAICITGNLNGESWQGADGTLRNKNVVTASSIEIVRGVDESIGSTLAPQPFSTYNTINIKEPPLPIEKLWEELFSNPTRFYDNRVSKSNPRAPDFKHKGTQQGLWLDSHRLPVWVMKKLGGDPQAPIPMTRG